MMCLLEIPPRKLPAITTVLLCCKVQQLCISNVSWAQYHDMYTINLQLQYRDAHMIGISTSIHEGHHENLVLARLQCIIQVPA